MVSSIQQRGIKKIRTSFVTGGEQVIVPIDQRVEESIKSECRDVISWIVLFNMIRNDAELC